MQQKEEVLDKLNMSGRLQLNKICEYLCIILTIKKPSSGLLSFIDSRVGHFCVLRSELRYLSHMPTFFECLSDTYSVLHMVDALWVNELLMHDFISRKLIFSRSHTTHLIQF